VKFRDLHVVGILALTQVISWGTIYYAFGVVAGSMQGELGWRPELIYGAMSWSLLAAGLTATPAGLLIDRLGGRAVMAGGSIVAGTGMLLLAHAHSVVVFLFAWTLLGCSMALTLYEAAFATINRAVTANPRKLISTLTLFGGFASTVFWPLTMLLVESEGWRHVYIVYGVLQILVCFPAHLFLPSVARPDRDVATASQGDRRSALGEAFRHPAFWKLALAFATNSFVFAALSVHLIPMLQRFGHPAAVVVVLVALIGPLQVLGRFGELAFAHRVRPQTVGTLTMAILPFSFLVLALAGSQQWAAALFCFLYGISNGILTIVRGTVPQELFGRENYGAISGALAGPALFAKAAGPLLFAVCLNASFDWRLALGALAALAIVSLISYLAAVRAAFRSPSALIV
jgi:MFS family permease